MPTPTPNPTPTPTPVTPPPSILNVNTTVDEKDGSCTDGDCSLRDAIASAKAGNSINIPAGTYTLTLGLELVIDKDLALVGAGAASTIIQAAANPGVASFRVFNITSGDAAISGVTIRHGTTGAEIYCRTDNCPSLSLTNSAINGNSGVGLFNNEGTLTLTNSTVSGNAGVGISNARTKTTITNSTISNNTGLGIYNWRGKLTISNSTISDNAGGVAIDGPAHGNTMVNSILAGNASATVQDCSAYSYWPLTSLGHNLIGNNTGCSFTPAEGDLVGTADKPIDPKLGPLQNNGGPTSTHALLPGSPAIDAGDDAKCPATDQRGVSRPQGQGCDIGAFEAY